MPHIDFVSREAMVKKYQETEGKEILPFYKYFGPGQGTGVEIKVPEDPKKDIVFAISTDAVDRDNDTIDVAGWNLKNYKKNPVIMWAHNYGEPNIGISKRTSVKDGVLTSVAHFVPKEIQPFAGMIEEMIRAGFIKATSVGFRGEELMFNEKRGGFDFKKQELLEYSVVPIPSNPEALLEAKSQGIDVSPMVQWAEKVCFIQKELMEEGDVYDMTWLKFLDDSVKALDKKTIAVNLDLMDTKGTFYEEVPTSPTLTTHTMGDLSKTVLTLPLANGGVVKTQDVVPAAIPGPESIVPNADKGEEPNEDEDPIDEHCIELIAEEPDECCVELEVEETSASMEQVMAGVTAGLQESIKRSFEHLPLEALIEKTIRQRVLGRLD